MPVISRSHPHVAGEGTRSGLVAAKTFSSSAGGQSIGWASGWTLDTGTAAPSLADSTLKRLTLRNNDAVESVLVSLGTSDEWVRVFAGDSLERYLFDTQIDIKVKDDTGTGQEIYAEATWDETVS